MKKHLRFTAFVIAVIMLATSLPLSVFAKTKQKESGLKFREDGTFTIVMFTDTHTTDQPYDEMVKLIEGALDKYTPDLVVFNGDNVTGGWYMSTPISVKNAIDSYISPVAKRNIPFAVTFGNHDWQTLTPKAWQIKMYQKYPTCLAEQGYVYHHRRANYNLLINSSDNTKPVFNLWFFDSGCKDIHNDQGCVRKEQIQWYEKNANALKEQNGGKMLPALAFQHVPVQEISKLFTEVDENTEGAKKCKDGKYYILNTEIAQGEFNGSPGWSPFNEGQYDSWVKTGDVIGAFFGHDHTNDFYGKTPDGITLGSTKTSGFDSRGDGHQGCRVIVLHEDDLENFDTFSAYYCDYVGGEIPESKREYDSARRWREIFSFLPFVNK